MPDKEINFVRVGEEIFRVRPSDMYAEVLTPEGTWVSADNRPASLFLEIMEAPPLSEEEIAALPTEKSLEKKTRVFQIAGYPKPHK